MGWGKKYEVEIFVQDMKVVKYFKALLNDLWFHNCNFSWFITWIYVFCSATLFMDKSFRNHLPAHVTPRFQFEGKVNIKLTT